MTTSSAAGGGDHVGLAGRRRLAARGPGLLAGADFLHDLLDVGHAGPRLHQQAAVGFVGDQHVAGVERRGGIDGEAGRGLFLPGRHQLGGKPGNQALRGRLVLDRRGGDGFDSVGGNIGIRRRREHVDILQHVDLGIPRRGADRLDVLGQGRCGKVGLGRLRHLDFGRRAFRLLEGLAQDRHGLCGAPLAEIVEAAGDLHQGLMQGREGFRRPLLARTRMRFERTQVLGQAGDGGNIGRVRRLRRHHAGPRIGFDHRLGRLARRFDDEFVAGRHVILDRRHLVRQGSGSGGGNSIARLIEQRRQRGDLLFEVAQRACVGSRRLGGLVEPRGDIDQPVLEPRHGELIDRGRRGADRGRAFELVEPLGQHLESLHQGVGGTVQSIDLAGNIGKMAGIFRLRLRLAEIPLDQLGKLADAFFQPLRRVLVGELLDALGERLDASGNLAFAVGRLQHVDMGREFRDPVFEPLEGGAVGAGRALGSAGGNCPADLVEPVVEGGKLMGKIAAHLDIAAEALDRFGEQDQLVFQRPHGRRGAQLAKAGFEIVDPPGKLHQFVLERVGIRALALALGPVPAILQAADAVLAGKAGGHRAQVFELGAQFLGALQAIARTEPVDAVAEADEFVADQIEIVGIAGRDTLETADLVADFAEIMGEMIGAGALLEFGTQRGERRGNVVEGLGLQWRCDMLRFGPGRLAHLGLAARLRLIAVVGFVSRRALHGGRDTVARPQSPLALEDFVDRIGSVGTGRRVLAFAHQALNARLKPLDRPVELIQRGFATVAWSI